MSEAKFCLDYWIATNHPRWIATAKLQLATIEAEQGIKTSAVTHLSESANEYERVGDLGGEKRARSLLSTMVSSPDDALENKA